MKLWCDFATVFFFFLSLKLGQSGLVTLTFAFKYTAWKLQTWGGSSLNYSHNLVFPLFALLMSVLVILVLWSMHVRDAWGCAASSGEVGGGGVLPWLCRAGRCLMSLLDAATARWEEGMGGVSGVATPNHTLTLVTDSSPADQSGQTIDYAHKYNYSPLLFESWQIARAKALVRIHFLLWLAWKSTRSADIMCFKGGFIKKNAASSATLYLFIPHSHTQGNIVECGLAVWAHCFEMEMPEFWGHTQTHIRTT